MSKTAQHDPYSGYKELTLRGVLLGFFITIIFTASNIYLGLKVGLTFASSIPAAVLAMALLKFTKNSNILENNLVQTQASAAGTLSAVVFVIPALLMLGYWQSFPFWQITLLCLSGGILGVLFTIPLRRVMVVHSSLPYPEGVAAAEILKAGNSHGVIANPLGEVLQEQPQLISKSAQIKEILYGSLYAAVISFMTNGLRLFSDSASFWFKSGSSIFQLPFGFSLALLGAGSLIGLSAGLAILLGLFLTWGVFVPYYSHLELVPTAANIAQIGQHIWNEKVRFIGAGTIGMAAIWTLIILAKPMYEGLKLSFSAYGKGSKQHTPLNRADQDLHPTSILMLFICITLITISTFYHFIEAASFSTGLAWSLVIMVTLLTIFVGFLIAAACGYMAGLVGSSSSPISGIAILAVILFSVILFMFGLNQHLMQDPHNVQYLTALALFSTSAVIATAAISNDNLQDLKTGYLIYATPAKQQIALIIGCVAGALVIAPLLQLLYQAYGFSGVMPRADMDPTQVLSAPQASLMALIAKGIFSGELEWNYILIGMGLGLSLIIVDSLLKYCSKAKQSIPPLAVGLGIYLPPAVSVPLVIGAVLVWIIRWKIRSKQHAENRLKIFEQKTTLLAAGLIVGESLMGVLLAMIIVATTTLGGSDAPLALNLTGWENIAPLLGFTVFLISIYLFVRRSFKSD